MATVDNLAALLELLLNEPELGVREMGRRLNLDKSSVQRLVNGLVRANFIEKAEETGRYRLGLRFIEFGFMVQARNDLRDLAWPTMRVLARLTGESVHLAVIHGLEMVHIGNLQGSKTYKPEAKLAHRSELYNSSLGKAVLAFQDDDTIARVTQRGLRAVTPHTITDQMQLRRVLGFIRRRGYAISLGELLADQCAVAAPIRNADGLVFAAIAVSGPSERMSRSIIASVIEPVMTAANHISSELGWPSSVTTPGIAARGPHRRPSSRVPLRETQPLRRG